VNRHCWGGQVEEDEWLWHLARIKVERNAYRILVEKPGGKRPFRKPRYRYEHNTKTGLKEIRWNGEDWVHVTRDRENCRNPMDMEFKFRVLQDARNFLVTWGAVSSSTRTLLHCVSINNNNKNNNNNKWRMQIFNYISCEVETEFNLWTFSD